MGFRVNGFDPCRGLVRREARGGWREGGQHGLIRRVVRRYFVRRLRRGARPFVRRLVRRLCRRFLVRREWAWGRGEGGGGGVSGGEAVGAVEYYIRVDWPPLLGGRDVRETTERLRETVHPNDFGSRNGPSKRL